MTENRHIPDHHHLFSACVLYVDLQPGHIHHSLATLWRLYNNVTTRYFAWTANGKSKMERMKNGTAQETKCNKGLWDCPRFKYSKETQELLQVMMQESRLTTFQQRHINNQLKTGGTLPVTCHPTSSTTPVQPELRISKGPVLSFRSQKRRAEQCSAGDNYTRERFRPSATRDLEKEKRRLQNIFATGQEETPPLPSRTRPANRTEDTETDRFQEILNEIEERRQFLEDMNALGKGNQYHHIINSEISQKIRELEVIDRVRSEELKRIEGKVQKAEEQP
ncbi:hypothetical protein HF521_000234 [Silurus meridionalis]|uniref:Uncharacterized protein n=2 Tax=Silurus meridionalis TaxID=175797 RepID=A0A8T0BXU4_SILME|nr:hypothetical protein HF521_000234 [Silurus meridionalis]